MNIFHNNTETANAVGWHHVPEYCFGDLSASFVVHDEDAGTFTFMSATELGVHVAGVIADEHYAKVAA